MSRHCRVNRSTPRIPRGQLFLDNSLRLTSVVQSWFADQTMDTSDFIKRVDSAKKPDDNVSDCEVALDPDEIVTDFDPSQAQGEWEEENAMIAEEERRKNDVHHQQSEVAAYESDDGFPLTQLPALPRPLKRKASPERSPSPQPEPKKRGKTGIQMTLASLLLMLMPIRLDNYGEAYQKYQKIPKTKGNQRLLQVLHSILSYWGDISAIRPGNESFQKWLKEDSESALYTTVCPSAIQRKLSEWLSEYTTPRTEDSSTIGLRISASSSSGTTRRVQRSPITYTSSTIADGRVPPAGASPSLPYPGLQGIEEEPELSANYRPKTSGILRSMSWRDTVNRYSLRSKANSGDRIVKLEIFNANEVMGLPSSDWWKHAETRAFVMCNHRSEMYNTAVQLKHHMRKVLESDPDHEGDYVQLRY